MNVTLLVVDLNRKPSSTDILILALCTRPAEISRLGAKTLLLSTSVLTDNPTSSLARVLPVVSCPAAKEILCAPAGNVAFPTVQITFNDKNDDKEQDSDVKPALELNTPTGLD